MFRQLKIENFYCFQSFELNHLGRVNLIVGENNSGKTTILESIQLFCSQANNKSLFLSPSFLTTLELSELFNQVLLKPEEDFVYQALQIIDPNIKRIALLPHEINNHHSRFFVQLKDIQKLIPLASMGHGIWRMFGLSLALVSAKDGVLLVDEIDTGLHYSTLENMWKLIWSTSNQLNVQVLATTHNSDCWKALETLTSREDVAEEELSIQRIEQDVPHSVAYNKEEIANAVEREIELR